MLSVEFFRTCGILELVVSCFGNGHYRVSIFVGNAINNSMFPYFSYKIWGRELTLDTNPYECGLGGLVDLDKKVE